jgi:hypothetical protein
MRSFEASPESQEQFAARMGDWIETELRYPCPIDKPVAYAEWVAQGMPEL